MRVKKHHLARAGAVVLVAFAMTACSDWAMRLPGEWVLSRWSAGEYVVFKAGEDGRIENQVGPTVEGYRVFGKVVTGRVGPSDFPGEHPTPGYFVVDTATHRVWQGLDEAAWRERLRQLGIHRPPGLKRPSWWDGDREWYVWTRRDR